MQCDAAADDRSFIGIVLDVNVVIIRRLDFPYSADSFGVNHSFHWMKKLTVNALQNGQNKSPKKAIRYSFPTLSDRIVLEAGCNCS